MYNKITYINTLHSNMNKMKYITTLMKLDKNINEK